MYIEKQQPKDLWDYSNLNLCLLPLSCQRAWGLHTCGQIWGHVILLKMEFHTQKLKNKTMSGRKSHNMFNKNCIRIHSPIVIFIIIFVKKENVKYTTKQRPLVRHATYRKHLEFDLFPENAFSGLLQIKSTVLRMWSFKSGCSFLVPPSSLSGLLYGE